MAARPNMFIRILTVVLIVTPMAWLAASDARAGALEDGAVAFVETLSLDGIGSLTGQDVSMEKRIEKFRVMFNNSFHVPAIARFVLGRKNWKQASKEQQAEYMTLFEDLMVVSYVDLFSSYAGESLKIHKAVADDASRATVHTDIIRPNAADTRPIRVLWRVGTNGKLYKVLDLVVEGVSLSINYKRDFKSTIRRAGGLDGLLVELRAKTTKLREEAKGN